MKKIKWALLLLVFPVVLFAQNNEIEIEGVILDEGGMPIPYVAIGIIPKYIGTASNEDGGFSLKLSNENLSDTLTVSTIGFKTLKVKVQDYIHQTEKVITLIEDIVSLDEIVLMSSKDYVKLALKNLNKTSLSSTHQLNVLYRRFSAENNTSRFLVEHYIKILDRGPTQPAFEDIEVAQGRKSVDYRYIKQRQKFHAVEMVAKQDPIREGMYRGDYNWKKIGDTSYDGEDIVIVEGRDKNNVNKFIKLYIGVETYGIYKLEKSELSAVYIYKKNKDGKLFLSYHNREYINFQSVTPHMRNLLKLETNKIKLAYRHELIVLGIETERKKIKVNESFKGVDMGDMDISYNENFWETLSLPPESKFYKKNAEELESLFGVPLKTQFKTANKN